MVGNRQAPSRRRSQIRFSPRQRQILDFAARGSSDKQIAQALGLSVATIRTYLHRFYTDYGVHNRTEAVAIWLSRRVNTPSDTSPARPTRR